MNWDQIEGKWKQLAGSIKQRWGKLTDNDLTVIDGKKDQLIGKIQERYGIVREEAHSQVEEFARGFHSNDASTGTETGNKPSEPRREQARGVGKS
jgi:uncharacterized protein YjbJ (UPF0337 family)